MRALPAIEPLPPRVPAALPRVGAGLGLLRDPVAFFAKWRRRLGDTYVVDAFGYRMFCVFSGRGVAGLYALPEEQASFGLATYELVFKHKVPLEMLLGRRNRPHDLFGRSEVEFYLENLESAVRTEIDELGENGTFEIFTAARRLGYRLGFASWAGPEAASRRYAEALMRHFDALDSADSFVRPAQTLITKATGFRRERRAMHAIEGIFTEILRERRRGGGSRGDFLDQIYDSFADLPDGEREINVARDLMVIQMGAQSNLYAALAWTLVNLLLHPEIAERVRGGDDDLLERCANESIRTAQRSITLRQVLQPIEMSDETGTYKLSPGVFVTTMLAVNNNSAAPGLERFDPAHFAGRRLRDDVPLASRELVSTFGHGRHSCPAQRFSITAIRIATRRLLEAFELEPQFSAARPRRRQIGGVARAAAPCVVSYRRRA